MTGSRDGGIDKVRGVEEEREGDVLLADPVMTISLVKRPLGLSDIAVGWGLMWAWMSNGLAVSDDVGRMGYTYSEQEL